MRALLLFLVACGGQVEPTTEIGAEPTEPNITQAEAEAPTGHVCVTNQMTGGGYVLPGCVIGSECDGGVCK